MRLMIYIEQVLKGNMITNCEDNLFMSMVDHFGIIKYIFTSNVIKLYRQLKTTHKC